jgi:hypothetical protein
MSAEPTRVVRPLVINIPPPPRWRVVRSWVVLTAIPLAYVGFMVGLPIVLFGNRRPLGDPQRDLLKHAATLIIGTVALTTALYLPRILRWPRREQVLEVTPDAIVVARIDPWRRTRREVPVAAVENVGCFLSGQVYAFGKGRRTLLLEFLSRDEAKHWAKELRQALGLPQEGRLAKKS